MKGLMTWTLKILLYVFVGYISISGIISGTADQTAVKATKLTLSGMIPVVGGILSDASETILVSAGLIKNALGVYGFLSIVAITITPFLLIGINYLSLKLITAFAGIFVSKTISKLLDDFTGALGMVLGMTGSVCLIQLISIVCFLKGMG
jgi:stage III sporulation protein AE